MPTAISPIYLEERKPVAVAMNPSLQTYIQDHLAASVFALDILRQLEQQDLDAALASFATDLYREIDEDRAELLEIASIRGLRRSGPKEFLARVAERFCRPKLNFRSKGLLGVFESLETLALGVIGKHGMWVSLEPLPAFHVGDADFLRLKTRAMDQFRRIEAHRTRIGRELLGNGR